MAFLEFFISVLVSLFVAVDVIANVPIFISLTEKYPAKDRKAIASKAILIAFIVLMVMVFLGQQIFDYLKVNLSSFQIAGGIVLFIIAIEMLFGSKTRTEYSGQELEEEKESITVTPLAIPLHTGPAAITTGIVFFSTAGTLDLKIAFVIAAICVYIASLVILVKSDILLKLFNRVGLKVFSRIMGLILASIAVQFVVDGITHAIMLA